ncbi:hypothetical protein [Legionella parisiensis]|uniref:LidA long coiled-coil domain-containing protein n=1 Tax=Legionella parisiensis TaxID=45071 RepID=A0A1E5JLV7_9GAMM|nr:hypothetical protein [Legionella parisiensis]KTD41344.1 hypothetical protein Lpar_2661 [Legionella parisiensis]OEH45509.1 hypothetical protein lpari_03560 [Legionella parisiensis]STX76353.1 Uncharacterised protein [Legionella parisiensis]
MANASQPAPIALTSSQLEKWFANIEKGNGSTTTETNSSLAARFVARFGLQNATQVIEFLKTAGGNETVNMIVKEIMKEEAQIQFIREKNAEEQLRQQLLLFLLMSLIAKNKSQAEHVSEQTQQQDNQKLKEARVEWNKESRSIAANLADANARANMLQELDKELRQLETDLQEVEKELEDIEEAVLLMEDHHAYITDDLDQLTAYLQLPLVNNQPITHAHVHQQIATLSSQLTALRAQHAIPIPTTTNDTTQLQLTKLRIDRKIRMLEDRLSFHKAQLEQPPQTYEQVLQQLLDRVKSRLNQPETVYESPTHREREEESLRLQERGLSQALQVLRNERILLNSQLERVYDFSQARLIVDPSHMSRYRRYGDSYAYFSNDITHEHQLSEQDWLQAKLNYDESRSNICTINFFHNDHMSREVESLRGRTQFCQTRAQDLMSRIEKVQTTKLQLLPEKTSFSMTPKPQPKSSYSLMLERLVPSHAPAPRPQDIIRAHKELEAVVPPYNKDALHKLIDEVRPDEIMAPEIRFSWFNRFKRLMPDVPVPEAEDESRLKHRK